MYIFEGYPVEDDKEPQYGIREFDGILGEDKIIAYGTDENKLKRVFRNLKRGGGFETMTPEFFKTVNFFVDKK